MPCVPGSASRRMSWMRQDWSKVEVSQSWREIVINRFWKSVFVIIQSQRFGIFLSIFEPYSYLSWAEKGWDWTQQNLPTGSFDICFTVLHQVPNLGRLLFVGDHASRSARVEIDRVRVRHCSCRGNLMHVKRCGMMRHIFGRVWTCSKMLNCGSWCLESRFSWLKHYFYIRYCETPKLNVPHQQFKGSLATGFREWNPRGYEVFILRLATRVWEQVTIETFPARFTASLK